LLELWGCDERILDNPTTVSSLLRKAAKASRAQPVCSVCRHFDPEGVSGFMMVQESHFSIHTWPERGYAAVDAFTCGWRCDPMQAVDVFRRGLKAQSSEVREIERGVPSGAQERAQALAAAS
jgi:S-adenosylmethionine decarboxylase